MPVATCRCRTSLQKAMGLFFFFFFSFGRYISMTGVLFLVLIDKSMDQISLTMSLKRWRHKTTLNRGSTGGGLDKRERWFPVFNHCQDLESMYIRPPTTDRARSLGRSARGFALWLWFGRRRVGTPGPCKRSRALRWRGAAVDASSTGNTLLQNLVYKAGSQ